MARLSRLALTGAAAVLSGSARAADLPPIPFPPEATSGPAEFGGWYLRGDVGAGVNMTAPELRGAPDPIVAGVRGFIIGAAPQTFERHDAIDVRHRGRRRRLSVRQLVSGRRDD